MPPQNVHQSEDDLRDKLRTVREHDLPATVVDLVSEYERRVGDRDRFLWQWLHYLFPDITLSSVATEHEQRVRDVKLVASMFVVLLDDLAENRVDRETFEEASKIPFDHQSIDLDRGDADESVLRFADVVWNDLETTLVDAPQYEAFQNHLAFDLKQNINAIDYSYIVNQHLEMATLDETEIYDAHNMMLFTYTGIDLMHSPSFDRDDVALLRSAVTRAQRMARIGNWITTWEREVHEGDYSSGVVVYALENDVVPSERLYHAREDDSGVEAEAIIETIHENDVEDIFLHRWQQNYAEVKELDPRIESVDLARFLDGMQKVMQFHLASRGWK